MSSSGQKIPVTNEVEEEDDDPVVGMIKKTGCLKWHYEIQVSGEKVEGCINSFINDITP